MWLQVVWQGLRHQTNRFFRPNITNPVFFRSLELLAFLKMILLGAKSPELPPESEDQQPTLPLFREVLWIWERLPMPVEGMPLTPFAERPLPPPSTFEKPKFPPTNKRQKETDWPPGPLKSGHPSRLGGLTGLQPPWLVWPA